jgi:aminoglycoside phosphotransferase family enzyme/predicted kinase
VPVDAPDLLALINGLSNPNAYPHPVQGIRVIQTHASCVFLTGKYVYKVKKPVDFGFLDYRTLEKRRHCCEQELALNRRLCPDVYLDVVPITRLNGDFQVGTSGAPGAPDVPVEWAVQMRQLPEEDMLPARLAAGNVEPAHLERIAALLADFHQQCATGPEISKYGSLEAVRRNVEENFTQTASRIGEALPLAHFLAIREYAQRFLAEHRDRFLMRLTDSQIRDGHGDLRAQNLCLHAGLSNGVQILDCIEFNDRLRYGDVASDLAYLAMDLDLAGRSDLRRVLVKTYVEAAEDTKLSGVLPFYECYRAYVRGKISLLAADEVEIPPEERRQHWELATVAFDLSRSYAQRRLAPALFVTVGYSGSGKSVLARGLARRLPAVRIATDDVRKELAGVEQSYRLPADHYGAEAKRLVYQELYRRAGELLSAGEHVLLDGTFLAEDERAAAAAVARDTGAEFWALECCCPDLLIRERLRDRLAQAMDPSDADLTIYEAQRQDETFLSELPQPLGTRWLAVDTGLQADDAPRKVLNTFWGATHVAPER